MTGTLNIELNILGIRLTGVPALEVGRRVSDSAQEMTTWLSLQGVDEKTRNPRPHPLEEEVTALFCDHRIPLLRYILSLGLSPQDGEDVVQEVFIALFHHLLEEKSKANLRGWIFKVGHNFAMKRHGRNHRRGETTLQDELAYADPAPNPEEQVALDRKQARLWAIVQALPERDRWCLSLKAEGLRYRDIAETLEMSLGSVALSLSRSLAKLNSVDER